MKKFSNKGFVLAETIVVAVFMVTIFSALYSNYFPIMANYEKREYYDDLDSKYTAFWLKYIMQDSSYKVNLTSITGSNYTFFDCNNVKDSYKNKACRRLVIEAGLVDNPFCKTTGNTKCAITDPTVDKEKNLYYNPLLPNTTNAKMELKYVAIITPYRLDLFKGNLIPNNPLYTNISDGMIDYINSLPDYTKESSTGAKYRLIIELYDNRERERPPLYKYATIEVSK